ncbi:unannotated protein [freshwater metagenome]|uniref:Unannotated protein n=1 Tax=freshwater metagenome TaxID=449393 RepID=A0A6J6BER8_9ZZZZ
MGNHLSHLTRREPFVNQATLTYVLIAIKSDDGHVPGNLWPDAKPAAVGLFVSTQGKYVFMARRNVQIVESVVVKMIKAAQPSKQVVRVIKYSRISEIGIRIINCRLCNGHADPFLFTEDLVGRVPRSNDHTPY